MKDTPRVVKAKLTQVIAERELQVVVKGRRKKAYVRFGKPRLLPEGRDYGCVYQIEGLHEEPITRRLCGVDSTQALMAAMQMAMVELICSSAYESGRLTWMGMYDLGLPVLDLIRDQIEKDPKTERLRREMAAKLDGPARRRRGPGAGG